MKKHKRSSEDWLSALTVMGRILIFVPFILGLIVLLFSVFGYNPIGLDTLSAGASMVFLCGTVTLVYVAVKRFREGLHGDVGAEDSQE